LFISVLVISIVAASMALYPVAHGNGHGEYTETWTQETATTSSEEQQTQEKSWFAEHPYLTGVSIVGIAVGAYLAGAVGAYICLEYGISEFALIVGTKLWTAPVIGAGIRLIAAGLQRATRTGVPTLRAAYDGLWSSYEAAKDYLAHMKFTSNTDIDMQTRPRSDFPRGYEGSKQWQEQFYQK